MRKILRGPRGATLELDSAQYYPDDPGNGTPALVCYRNGCSTFTCSESEGTVYESDRGDIKLPQPVLEWLASEAVQNEVECMYQSGHSGAW